MAQNPKDIQMVVRIRTLGRFEVEVDGAPLHFHGKAPRKPLGLLKIIVALGGEDVPVEQVTDALWPDLDGDGAYRAFTNGLARLRKLTAPEAIRLHDRRLSLRHDLVWVDASAFDHNVTEANLALAAGDRETAWKCSQACIGLYRGRFLDGEFDFPEYLAARNSLHDAFKRHVDEMGRALAADGRWNDAAELYQRALEVDELAEEFYLGLMQCHRQKGRIADAVSLFERCRAMLSAQVGVEPSEELQEAHRSLMATGSLTHVDAAAEQAIVSNKPTVAVLPFQNLSGDADQDYFAAGITKDINTGLIGIPGIFLISRRNTFLFQGQQVTYEQVGRELGVRYVVGGSVRKVGDNVRISAELVEAPTGRHLWARHYDRTLEDLFSLQDEITEEIVTSLNVTLLTGEGARTIHRALRNPEAREWYYRGRELLHANNRESIAAAIPMFDQVMRLEPESSIGYWAMAWARWHESSHGWGEHPQRSVEVAAGLAEKALTFDDTGGMAQILLGNLHLQARRFDDAITRCEEAASLRSSCPATYALKANIKTFIGEADQAVQLAKVSIRLEPARSTMYLSILGRAHYHCGLYEEAVAVAGDAAALNAESLDAHIILAAAHSALGNLDAAGVHAATVLRNHPTFSLGRFAETQPYQNENMMNGLLDHLRDAGLR